MLPDRYTELLAAYVDGDLSSRQRKAVLKLLHRSSEARMILKEMQENSHALQNMPAKKLGADFPAEVLQEIQVRGLQPGTAPPATPTVWRIPTWARFAAAAAVLAMAAFGSYKIFTPKEKESEQLAKETPLKFPPARERKEPIPVLPQIAKKDPEPEPKQPEPMFTRVDGKVRVKAENLSKPEMQAVLVKEFPKEKSVHLDLTVRDKGKAVQTLIAAMKANKVTVYVDDQAKTEIKKPVPTKKYLVYLENLKADDLAKILGKLDGAEGDTMVIGGAMTDDDQKLLKKHLGEKLELFNPIIAPPKSKGKKDQGENPIQVTPPPGQPVAVVLALDGTNAASGLAVRQFLEKRQGRKQPPNTYNVVLVVHSV